MMVYLLLYVLKKMIDDPLSVVHFRNTHATSARNGGLRAIAGNSACGRVRAATSVSGLRPLQRRGWYGATAGVVDPGQRPQSVVVDLCRAAVISALPWGDAADRTTDLRAQAGGKTSFFPTM